MYLALFKLRIHMLLHEWSTWLQEHSVSLWGTDFWPKEGELATNGDQSILSDSHSASNETEGGELEGHDVHKKLYALSEKVWDTVSALESDSIVILCLTLVLATVMYLRAR